MAHSGDVIIRTHHLAKRYGKVVADPLISQVFRSLGGFWAELSRYTMAALGKSVATFRGDLMPALLSDQLLAAGLLFAYMLVFGVATPTIFERTDVRFTAA
jgi:hypothetical protein